MINENLIRQHAKNYVVCFNGDCSVRNECLRWLAGCCQDDEWLVYAVNHNSQGAGGETCRHLRKAVEMEMPVGFVHMFDSIAEKKARAVRKDMLGEMGPNCYYVHRRGDKPMTPELQKVVRNIFKKNGVEDAPQYDGTAKTYNW